jgi:hypothetical protein
MEIKVKFQLVFDAERIIAAHLMAKWFSEISPLPMRPALGITISAKE